MSLPPRIVHPVADDQWLGLEDLARAAGVEAAWLRERVQEGLLGEAGLASDASRFEASTIRRVRCMVRLERDFDAAPELAALVADLEDEIARLRERLRP